MYRIYRYTCIPTGQGYIGCTSQKHQSSRAGKNGINYVKKNGAFGQAIQEFGWSNFKYEVIGYCAEKDAADFTERYFIEKENTIFPNGLNLENGGTFEKKLNDRTMDRLNNLGEKYKGRYKNNPECSKKVYQFTKDGELVGEYPSAMEVSRQFNIAYTWLLTHLNGNRKRKSIKGFVWSYENVFPEWTIEKKPSKSIGKYNTKKSKAVRQLTLDGQLVAEYPSVMEVQRQLGFHNVSIGRVCKGERYKAYGFRWEYA